MRFQCVDTLELVLKHAEGMSLRCDVILRASLIVVGMNHRILSRLTQIAQISLSLWVRNLTEALRWFSPTAHTDSTKFNEKMVCGNLC